jgi:anti-anti-sigma factor
LVYVRLSEKMKIKGSKNNIAIEGNLIFDNAEEVKEGLLKRLDKLNNKSDIGIDLSKLEEVDSSGIQLLIAFFKSLENRHLKYAVSGINDETMEILELSGLNKYFRFEL